MESPDALNLVATFHRTFEHPIVATPALPPPERAALRVALLREELDELQAAIAVGDLVGVADALCDLQYVLAGAVLEFGLGEKFNALFAEVQRSNLSKRCANLEEAEATVAYYEKERNTPAYFKATPEGYLVFRLSDHKTLKSINYAPPQLASILAEPERENPPA